MARAKRRLVWIKRTRHGRFNRNRKRRNKRIHKIFYHFLTNIKEFADAVRKHWCIENQLHWCLDVIFREDYSRARKEHSPLNMNVLRKTALNLISQIQSQYHRISKKKLMFKAALEPDLFIKILFLTKSKCCCPGQHC